jgi:hypothetical protein
MAHSTQLPNQQVNRDRPQAEIIPLGQSKPVHWMPFTAMRIDRIKQIWIGLQRPKRDRPPLKRLYLGWFGGVQFYDSGE